MGTNITTLKKIEEQLIYAKAKQEVLEDVFLNAKEQYEKRDLFNELTNLKDDVLLGEITLNGYRWCDFSEGDRQIIASGIQFAIEMLSQTKVLKESESKYDEAPICERKVFSADDGG